MTGFEERYEVGCPSCRTIEGYFPTYNEAWGIAGLLVAKWHQGCCYVTIYDRMAHKGKPELWRHDGLCLQIKGQR